MYLVLFLISATQNVHKEIPPGKTQLEESTTCILRKKKETKVI